MQCAFEQRMQRTSGNNGKAVNFVLDAIQHNTPVGSNFVGKVSLRIR